MRIVTGDEILDVMYKDGSKKSFDTSSDRILDYDDAEYDIYSDGKWIIDLKTFSNRKNSYDMLDQDKQTEIEIKALFDLKDLGVF